LIDLRLNPNVGGRFDLKIAAAFVFVELSREGTLNVARPCVVPFD
jgi:hypothetical protein